MANAVKIDFNVRAPSGTSHSQVLQKRLRVDLACHSRSLLQWRAQRLTPSDPSCSFFKIGTQNPHFDHCFADVHSIGRYSRKHPDPRLGKLRLRTDRQLFALSCTAIAFMAADIAMAQTPHQDGAKLGEVRQAARDLAACFMLLSSKPRPMDSSATLKGRNCLASSKLRDSSSDVALSARSARHSQIENRRSSNLRPGRHAVI